MALTLPDDVKAGLDDLADAEGRPAATIAVELLTQMVPQMHDLAKLARFAKQGNKAAAKRALQHMLGNAMAEVIAEHQPDMFKAKAAKRTR